MSKTKYLITESWNGEGYSDSDIEIIEVENYPNGEANLQDLKSQLIAKTAQISYLTSIEITDSSITYQIDNDCLDAGVYHFEPLTEDILAVAIFPHNCEHEVIRDNEMLKEYKSLVRESLAEEYTEFEESQIFGHCAEVKGKDESDLILRNIT
jgi:hypothetical protein